MAVESPGSLNNFRDRHPDLPAKEAYEEWGQQIATYREELARERNVTLAELHELPHQRVIDLTLEAAGVEVA
jgi:hypothetical protein